MVTIVNGHCLNFSDITDGTWVCDCSPREASAPKDGQFSLFTGLREEPNNFPFLVSKLRVLVRFDVRRVDFYKLFIRGKYLSTLLVLYTCDVCVH